MARLWLAVAALLGFAFVALLALWAHGPQLLAALLDIGLPEDAGPPPPGAAAGAKPGSAIAAAGAAGQTGLAAIEQALVVHGFHALALGLAALWIERRGGLFANLAALGFAAGTVLFCVPIWARALGEPMDPGLTPMGGSILLGAWAIFALAALFGGSAASAAASPARPTAPAVSRTSPAPSSRPGASTPQRGWMAGGSPPASAQQAPPAPAPRTLPVEARHQPPAAPRPAVSGGPKRPAVSR
ncbi:MAG: DUF423 domain-containing protein [Acetobacteraceae bacterium]|nr:DUF423 domain-containing protein [Acetobacteraceae bacterium]